MNTTNKTIQQLVIENITQNVEFSMLKKHFFTSQCIHLTHVLLTDETIDMIPDIVKIKGVKKVKHKKGQKLIEIYNMNNIDLAIITLFY